MSADTLSNGGNKKQQARDTIGHGSAQTTRTSQHGVRKQTSDMLDVTADVAIFWLMVVALAAVTYDPRPDTQVHGVTVGFTALGVLCAAAAASTSLPHGERSLVDRCLAMCVGSAAAQGACSGTTLAHRVTTAAASVAVVTWGGGNTIKVRHAGTMTDAP